MGLHHLGGLGAALNDVRVNGSLAQEIDAVQLSGLLLEHADKLAADDLALLLGIGHVLQLAQETLHRVHIDQVGVELVLEHLHHALGLVLSHQAVVHVHANQLIADGF